MSLGYLHSLYSLRLRAPLTMNSASVRVPKGCWGWRVVLFLQLICRRGFFANQALQLSLDSVLAEASSSQVCVCYAIPEYVAGTLLAALVIWVLLPAEKLWDGCPHSPATSWDKHRHWSRGGCRCDPLV